MKFRIGLSIVLVSVLSCDSTTDTILDQLNLDRPVDIAFACYGGLRLTGGGAATLDQDVIPTAMPLQACDIRSQAYATGASAPVPPGQETLSPASNPGLSFYYGFVLQSEPGTVAIAQWDTKPSSSFAGGDVVVLDADPLVPGKNSIAVGEDPIAIASDTVGCYEITANAGSCDLSTIEVNSAIEVATDNADAVANGKSVQINRIAVKNASGAVIRAKPAAMVAEPPSGTIGNACPATPTGLVYIAYPGCHLVAGVDMSTGTIVNGIQYDASGVATIVDGNVTCPDECGAGDVITAGPRPVSVDLQLDDRTQRRALAIGSVNTNVVSIVDLDISDKPSSISNVVLEQNKTANLGVTVVKISPTIGMGGSDGMINDDSALGGQFQFVYAIATDNTVRVANILNVVNKECDTQIDPRFLHNNTNVQQLSCLPLGDPTLPRRAGARGPGIQLIGDSNPTSIDIFRVPAIDGDTRAPGVPLRLVGYFGVITASSGAAYVLNVDNDDGPGFGGGYDYFDPENAVASAIPLDIAHQLRDAVPDRAALAQAADENGVEQTICDTDGVDPDGTAAPDQSTRYTGTTTRTLPTSTFATEKIDALPNLRQVTCVGTDEPTGKPVSELSFAADQTTRSQVFPDLFGEPFYDETYTLTYEGSLSIDTSSSANDGPSIRTSQMYINATDIQLVDQTRPYCDAGVEPWDVVQLRGCDSTLGNSDCPIGYTCFVHPESQISNFGACMLADEADRLAVACKEFLTSQRQYTVSTTTSGELRLLPRKHVLLTTPVDGCTSDQQCQDLGTFNLLNQGSAVVDPATVDTHTYTCAVDTARAPELAADGTSALKRCIQTCSVDTDCDTGTVCDNGTCMEGVIPPQACVNAPQRYELRASEAFAVVGTHSGYHHPIVQDAFGNCVKNPNASLYDIGRIPLRAAACDPAADPYTGQRGDGTFDPNPCETTVDQSELQNNYVAGTCTLASPAQTLVTRAADAIRYRGRGLTLTMVNPTYPGDATCIGDRGGNRGRIPVAPKLYQAAVRIVSGFAPLLISTGAAYPVKVTRGPGESIWIMDEGDYISTSVDIASTRGKVFRVESPALTVINTLE